MIGEEQKFIFVRLSVLREYLRRDLQMPNLPFPYDFERAIDDWVKPSVAPCILAPCTLEPCTLPPCT